jgi:hypothetical protein
VRDWRHLRAVGACSGKKSDFHTKSIGRLARSLCNISSCLLNEQYQGNGLVDAVDGFHGGQVHSLVLKNKIRRGTNSLRLNLAVRSQPLHLSP